MKQLIYFLLFLIFSLSVKSDPHYIQALHPFWGEKSTNQFLSLFSEKLTSHVEKYESLRDHDVYIYVYVFNELDLASFNLDIDCSNEQKLMAINFWDISSGYKKTDERLSWTLNTDKQKQVVWFYAPYESKERIYQLTNSEGEVIREGVIEAPSCIITPALNVDNLTKKQRAIYNGETPYVDLKGASLDVDWTINADGNYVYNYSIKSDFNNIGEIARFYIDISCKWLPEERYGYRPESKDASNKLHYQYGIGDSKYIAHSSNMYSHRVYWSLSIKPGETLTGLQIISEEAPISRKYEISPSFENDYIIPEGTPYDDFIVTGMIDGPGCHSDNDYNNPYLSADKKRQRKKYLLEQKQRLEEKARIPPALCIGKECYQ